jgi:hypothetical protein
VIRRNSRRPPSSAVVENAAKVSFHHAVRRLQRWLGRTP